jgi:hypothetical protein
MNQVSHKTIPEKGEQWCVKYCVIWVKDSLKVHSSLRTILIIHPKAIPSHICGDVCCCSTPIRLLLTYLRKLISCENKVPMIVEILLLQFYYLFC